MTRIPSHFPLSEEIPDQHPQNAVRFDYINGRCWLFALALAGRTGLELALLWDAGANTPLHVFCREEASGRAVDAYGVVEDEWELLAAFDQEWNLARPEDPQIEQTTRSQVLALFNAGAEPDPAEMEAVLSDLDQLGFTLTAKPELCPLTETPAAFSGGTDAAVQVSV